MNADASQAQLSLAWFFALVGGVLFAIAIGLLIEGELKVRRARKTLQHPGRAPRTPAPRHLECSCPIDLTLDDQIDALKQAVPEHEREWRPDTKASIRQTVDLVNSWTALDDLQARRAMRQAQP